MFLSSRQNFLPSCWSWLPSFFQQSDCVFLWFFQILLYLKLKIKCFYPGMCCLSSLGPSPQHDNLRDFFAVGVYRLFFPSVLTASNTGTHRRQITDLLDQSIQVHSQCFVITSDNRYILLCGFWDKSFRVYSTDTGNRIASLSVNPSLQQVAVGGLKGFLISPVKLTEV